jgi:P27 family predicted phage terminase small subunit
MAQRGRKRQLESKTPPGPKPEPPDWISQDGRELWDKYSDTINSLGLLECLDAITFSLLCDSIATLQDMRDEFARDGDYVNICGAHGALQANPLVTMIAQQVKGVLALASEFGMTPRGRVNLTGSLSCNPDAAALNPMEQLLREVTGSAGTQTGAPAATPKTPPSGQTKRPAKKRPKSKPKKAAQQKPKRKKS